MGKIVVEVMPKPEILDPQGKAIKGLLACLGVTSLGHAHQGKRFELITTGNVTEADLETVREAVETLLSNPIIENVINVRKNVWIYVSGW